MKTAGFVTWIVLRVSRWLIWLGFFVYVWRVMLDRASYMDSFSRPLRSTEAMLYGLPLLAVALGFLELMMRERARIERPDYFRLMPPISS
jgi:hypothetical protein